MYDNVRVRRIETPPHYTIAAPPRLPYNEAMEISSQAPDDIEVIARQFDRLHRITATEWDNMRRSPLTPGEWDALLANAPDATRALLYRLAIRHGAAQPPAAGQPCVLCGHISDPPLAAGPDDLLYRLVRGGAHADTILRARNPAATEI